MPDDVSELLRAWSDGDPRALDGLTPLVYAERAGWRTAT